MKVWVITTRSESGDHYIYVVKHPKKPTDAELKAFLIEHSRDKEEGTCDTNAGTLYEVVQDIVEIRPQKALTISKLTKKQLNMWDTL